MRACRLAFLFLACCSLAGCFGAGTVTGKTQGWDEKDAGEWGLCPIGSGQMIVKCLDKSLADEAGVRNVTPEKLINMWGAPNQENIVHGMRTLSYRHGLAWRGLTVFVILPVPLLLPMGYNSAQFVFENGHLIHVEYTYNELDAAICGLHSEGPGGIGCISHWH